MARRISQLDIIKINKTYARCHNKAQTARECGVSAASVTKYLNPNYTTTPIIKSSIEIPEIDISMFTIDWARLLALTIQEKTDIEELRKEVSL